MNINRTDVVWNFFATLFRMASGVLVLPLVLHLLSSEDVGLWTVFTTVGSLTLLLDFGFSPTFTRNITYIFSGAKELKAEGYNVVENSKDKVIDYSLLKGMLIVIRRYYFFAAALLFIILLSAGSFYIKSVLNKYSGNYHLALVSWGLYMVIVVLQLYTLYYDAVLQGRGWIKKSKKIIVISQTAELAAMILCLLFGLGLLSMVISKAVSTIVSRILSRKAFFDMELVRHLKENEAFPPNELFKIVTPSSVKIGLTSLGGFMILKSSFFIGSMYLSLSDFASFGVTFQILGLIASLSNIYIVTYLPKIAYSRISDDKESIKRIYVKGVFAIILFYSLGSVFLVFFGNSALHIIHSNTMLVARPVMVIALLVSALEANLTMAGEVLLTKNEVPFVKASLSSGFAIVFLLLLSFKFTNLGLLGMVLIPLVVDLSYQAWKWPMMVVRELKIGLSDFRLIKVY